MNTSDSELTVGENISRHADVAAEIYASYVWMVHTHDYPEDLKEGSRAMGASPEMAALEAERWQHATRREVAQALCGQLNFVLRRVIDATQSSRNYETAMTKGQDSLVQLYLTDIVGPLAMRKVTEEEWWSSKNPYLKQLGNPFAESEILGFLWDRQEKRRTAIVGRAALPPYEKIIPGYPPATSEK